jgi:radical SAM-linked protein
VERDSGTPDGTREGPAVGAGTVTAEPRQRWRLAFRRPAADDLESRRDLVPEWLERLAANGLPLAVRAGTRARSPLSLAAPLPVGVAAEQDLADLLLAERLPAWRVREAVVAALPAGWVLVGICDVWLGAPALAATITGADYRVTLVPTDKLGPDDLSAGADSMLAEGVIRRIRYKGGREVAYDLRPLIAGIEVTGARPTVLKIRTRFDPERGSGRPEEVLAALSEHLGTSVAAAETVRERLLLESDLPNPVG